MASIKRRPDGVWRARYRDADGKEHARHFPRRIDAQNWLDGVTSSLVRGDYVDPKAGKVTFREFAEQWRAAQVFRPSTAEVVRRSLMVRVYPLIGDRRLDRLLQDDMQSLVKVLASKYAPRTVHVTYSYVATILKSAVVNRRLTNSPCVGIKLPKITKAVVVPLTMAQVVELAEAVSPRFRAGVLLAAGTGLRQGEIFGLSLDRVDFLRRTITVDRQVVSVDGQRPEFGPTKTPSSVRVVPLPDSVAKILAAHLKQWPVQEPEKLIFTNHAGEPWRRSSFGEMWRRATLKAGLPGTRFHELRHHYASLLIEGGASVKTVQALLGHKSAEETLNTYAHLWPDSDVRTSASVDAAFGILADSVRTRRGVAERQA